MREVSTERKAPGFPAVIGSLTERKMILAELPRLNLALDLMGVDNGSNVVATAKIPDDWEMRARLAEDELLPLTTEEMEDLTQGEQGDLNAVAARVPNAAAILDASFDDGPLAELFFEPWHNIFDARDAEDRVANKVSSTLSSTHRGGE
jgi:hypothetical protein